MAKLANVASVFHTFAYNFDDPNGLVKDLPATTVDHLDKMPPLITKWQADDIAANTVGDYYDNPAETATMLTMTTAMNIVYVTTDVTNLVSLRNKAIELANTANNFLAHTHRLSGIDKYDGTDDGTNPYLDLAMGLGKTALYITNQTDGIINNAPIMGSFTSLLISPQIIANTDIIVTYNSTLQNSIVANTVTTQVDDGNGGYTTQTTTTYESNLSSQIITTMSNKIDGLRTMMEYRRESDRVFYVNMKNFINKYNEVKKFNKMGNTESDMVQNLIGSQKLLDRLNS